MAGLRIAGTLIGAGLLAAAPALAEEADVPAYARTASTIATAIYEGDDLAAREDIFPLHPAEYAELARLAGCDGAARPTAMKRVVQIDWTCGEDSAHAGLSRSTVMMFAEDGRLVRFGINAPLDALAPTPAALEEGGRTYPRRIANRLGEAIAAGEDPSLGGLLPMTGLDRERLSGFAGGDYYVYKRSRGTALEGVDRVHRIRLLDADRASARIVHVFFDEEDRPLGLAFEPARDPAWTPDPRRGNAGSDVPGIRLWDVRNSQAAARAARTLQTPDD
ncbi:hypothetical protein [Erythrobacter sp.]|uniref:hypothetical protein n=1 Tax=Erythrobacter sp. TaxID=1042 RepID=UPI001425E78E|nr:hypothetical protein [Erythrobacter sp.]QIQ87331.1 MAG: hypothetical protein G9473_12025 [Erythrobacter sp.]